MLPLGGAEYLIDQLAGVNQADQHNHLQIGLGTISHDLVQASTNGQFDLVVARRISVAAEQPQDAALLTQENPGVDKTRQQPGLKVLDRPAQLADPGARRPGLLAGPDVAQGLVENVILG